MYTVNKNPITPICEVYYLFRWTIGSTDLGFITYLQTENLDVAN